MHGPLLSHGCTTGRHLWVVITVALGLALGSQTAATKECHKETPLPADVRLIAPGSEVPEVVARFAGVWSGAWLDKGREALCHTLVVEEVLANGYARITFSTGTYAGWAIRLPRFWRITGRIVDEVLRLHLPEPDRPKLAYRLVGETLQGTHNDAGHVRLTRLADLSQVGCSQPASAPPPAPPTTGPRDRLTAAELLAAAAASTGPVHNAYFLPVGQAASALHAFQGTVTLATSTMFRARHGCTDLAETQTLPGFTVAFFTHGEHLVPVVRDILDPLRIILSPGRVWSEPGDGGLSRASFPFVVVPEYYTSETHHGLATFLYDDTRVSALRVQIVQENVPRNQYDGWGQASMTYTPGPLPNAEALRAQFAAELQRQTPIRPWSALPAAAGAPGVEGFDGDTAPAHLKASGLIVDGVLYLRGCETRYGPYPYCRQMRHGVYSVTKSLGAAVALLRLAQKYGEQVFALKIKDYVTVTAAHDGWERVTFGDALNMATGIGDNWPQREPNHPFADELNSPNWWRWIKAQTAKVKLEAAFASGQYPWGPGEVFRYNSSHTFTLAAAMESFLKRQAGPQARLRDMVMAEVFQPIGIFHAPMLQTLEAEGEHGIPYLSEGLFLTIDDLAKLTTLLQHGGQHQGQQILHAAQLAEALYKTDARGLPNGMQNRFGEGRYHRSFWSLPYRTGNGCFFDIPYMSGAGGNLIVLLPNGLSAFRLADGDDYTVDPMVRAGEAIRLFPCPAGSGEAPTRERQPLSASELRAELAGHTFYADPMHMFPSLGGHLNIFLAAEGVKYGTFKAEPDSSTRGGTWHDVGRWHITPDGQFCHTWYMWGKGCYTVSREDETFVFYPQDRFGKEVFRRVLGNPEGY